MNYIIKKWVLPGVVILLFLSAGGYIVWEFFDGGNDDCKNKPGGCNVSVNNGENDDSFNRNNVNTADANLKNNVNTADANLGNISNITNTEPDGNVNKSPVFHDSAKVKKVRDAVYLPDPKPFLKTGWQLITSPTYLTTKPDGEAEISVSSCQHLHVFSDVGGDSKVQFSPKKAANLDRVMDIARGIITSFSQKCSDVVERVKAGTILIKSNGTWYTVRYFPENNDEKFIVLVLKDDENTVSSVTITAPASILGEESTESSNRTGSISKVVTERSLLFFSSDKKLGQCESGKPCNFPERYEDATDLYRVFNMDDWIPRVLAIYDNDVAGIAGDQNVSRFPVVNPVPLDTDIPFGRVQIDSSGESSIRISNPGKTPLNLNLNEPYIPYIIDNNEEFRARAVTTGLSNYTITVDNKYDVDLRLQNCTVLNAGGECSIIINYRPKTPGDLNAELILKHNADNEGKLTPIKLTGKALPKAAFRISPVPLNFADQVEKTESEPRLVNVGAINQSNPKIEKVWIRSADDSENKNYKIADNLCNGKILKMKTASNSEENCTVKVIFTPQTQDSHQAELVVEGGNGTEATSPLSGVGIPPKPNEANGTVIITSIKDKKFSPVTIGTESLLEEVKISLKGPNPVRVGQIIKSGSGTGAYILNDGCSGQIITTASPSCIVGIVFKPNSEGQHPAKLTIPTEVLDLDQNETVKILSDEVDLIGTVIRADPSSSCFSKRQKKVRKTSFGARATQTIQIEKEGDNEGIISDLEIITNNGVKSDDFSIPDKENCIGIKGPKCTITINFTPRKRRTRSAILIIRFKSQTDPLRVPITGVGKSRNWFLRFFFDAKDLIFKNKEKKCPS